MAKQTASFGASPVSVSVFEMTVGQPIHIEVRVTGDLTVGDHTVSMKTAVACSHGFLLYRPYPEGHELVCDWETHTDTLAAPAQTTGELSKTAGGDVDPSYGCDMSVIANAKMLNDGRKAAKKSRKSVLDGPVGLWEVTILLYGPEKERRNELTKRLCEISGGKGTDLSLDHMKSSAVYGASSRSAALEQVANAMTRFHREAGLTEDEEAECSLVVEIAAAPEWKAAKPRGIRAKLLGGIANRAARVSVGLDSVSAAMANNRYEKVRTYTASVWVPGQTEVPGSAKSVRPLRAALRSLDGDGVDPLEKTSTTFAALQILSREMRDEINMIDRDVELNLSVAPGD